MSNIQNDDDESVEEIIFNNEEIERMVIEILETTLVGKKYNQKKIPELQNLICEKIMRILCENERNLKYIINCCVMQNVGASLLSTSSCFIDVNQDYDLTVVWPKEKQKENFNRYLFCTVNIHALSF